MDEAKRFELISTHLSPERPIRSTEFLRGRAGDLEKVERELRHFHAVPFIYGYRGVGKTSLARTAAQLVTKSDREHIYVACAPGSRMLHIFREIGEEILKVLFKTGQGPMLLKSPFQMVESAQRDRALPDTRRAPREHSRTPTSVTLPCINDIERR